MDLVLIPRAMPYPKELRTFGAKWQPLDNLAQVIPDFTPSAAWVPVLTPEFLQKMTSYSKKPEAALILIGHGSTTNQDSSVTTHQHADEIRRRGIFGEVACGFWKEEPSIREVLYQVVSKEVYLVPNFISEGYFTRKVIPREFELEGAITKRGDRVLKYCDPVGSNPHITEVLQHRASTISSAIIPQETSLIIVGHGTSLNKNSAEAAKAQATLIGNQGIYGEVIAAYMEEEPWIREWDSLTKFSNVLVIPFFIADGLHSYEDIPVLLGIENAQDRKNDEIFRPYFLREKMLYYASAIGTDPLLADLILDQVAQFDAKYEVVF